MMAKTSMVLAAAGALIVTLGVVGSAQAGDKGHGRHGHHHGHHHVPSGHGHVYHPAPVYYAPAPVYVAPPPVYYAPAPMYAVPSRPVFSFGAVIPLR
jgi:hypothetical protein